LIQSWLQSNGFCGSDLERNTFQRQVYHDKNMKGISIFEIDPLSPYAQV